MPSFLAKLLVAAGVVLSAVAGMTSVAVGQAEPNQVETEERDSVSGNAQAEQWVRMVSSIAM